MELAGKHVLVTGGAVRVGAVIVRAFAAAGARVTRRVERGGGSDAACGQLRIKALKKDD